MIRVASLTTTLWCLVLAGSVQAGLINGSFETGDLTGWTPVSLQIDSAADYTVTMRANTRSLSENTILAESILGIDNFQATPEPSTLALLMAGVFVLAVRGWRRKR